MSDEPINRRLVVTGLCTLADQKPGIVLRVVIGRDELAEEIIFPRKVFSPVVIGGVYEIGQVSEKSWRVADRRFIGQYEDRDAVTAWQLEARAKQLIEDAAKAERAAADWRKAAAAKAWETMRAKKAAALALATA